MMTTSVAVLGTGIMGSGMAGSLLRAGLEVTVWNRTAARATGLADGGARVAANPPSAVADADVVLTTLFDLDAVESVMGPAVRAMRSSSIWVQTGTVGIPGTEQLVRMADRQGVGFVDAPVLGTRQPAEQGKLVVLAAGPPAVRDAVEPVLAAIGSRTIWVSERPGDGQRLKLAVNSWVTSIITGTAQAIGLAGGLGLDPQLFLDAISGSATDCQYAQLKGRAMIADEFPPAFTVSGVIKDIKLITEAMDVAGVRDPMMRAIQELFVAAAENGNADADMAAVVRAIRQ